MKRKDNFSTDSFDTLAGGCETGVKVVGYTYYFNKMYSGRKGLCLAVGKRRIKWWCFFLKGKE